jgi:hypothetical protein
MALEEQHRARLQRNCRGAVAGSRGASEGSRKAAELRALKEL